MDNISVIIPCFNEEASLPFYKEEILKVMQQMSSEEFELLFINDGSKDTTLPLLKQYAAEDSRFKYVSFSRNFGKEAAMYAGLEAASACRGIFSLLPDKR